MLPLDPASTRTPTTRVAEIHDRPVAPTPDAKPKRKEYRDGFDAIRGHRNEMIQARHNLHGVTDASLDGRIEFLKARIADAESGPVTNRAVSERAKQDLALAENELATRKKLQGKPEELRLHRLSTEDLNAELKKAEGLAESQDPKVSFAAKHQVEKILAEENQRIEEAKMAGTFTKVPGIKVMDAEERAKSDWAIGLRGASDKALKSKLKTLDATEADATHGASRMRAVAKNAQTDMELIKSEQALRAELAKGPQPELARKLHALPTEQLQPEIQKAVQRYTHATAKNDLAGARKAQDQLQLISNEIGRRNIPVKSADLAESRISNTVTALSGYIDVNALSQQLGHQATSADFGGAIAELAGKLESDPNTVALLTKIGKDHLGFDPAHNSEADVDAFLEQLKATLLKQTGAAQ